jgi:hypothetical protein
MNRMTVGRYVAAAGLLVLALEGATLLPLRARFILAIHVAVLGLLAWMRWREILAPPVRRALFAGFAITVIPALAGAVLGHEDPLQVVVVTLEPTLAGWCAALVLLPLANEAVPDERSTEWRPKPWQASLFLAGAFAVLAVSHQLAVQHLAIVSDEAVMLAQARWMHFPQVAWPVDADIAPFFRMRKVDYLNGQMYGMYPPGWPALMAAFRYVGLEWWSNVIAGTLAVALAYLIGARLHSPRVGAVAAVLLATSQLFLQNLAGYMAHGAALAGLLGATWFLLIGIDHRGWRRIAPWMVAGLLFGLVVTVRPLTGLALGLSVGLWMLARTWRMERRAVLTMAACVTLGGLLPAWLFIEYNLAVFGTPVALGYDVMHPGLYKLGFGQRGFRVLDENLEWVPNSFYFGPMLAFRTLVRLLVGVNTTFVPVGMLVPITALAVASGFRVRWPLVAAFSILPAALFFYWGSNLRLWVELLPFVLLATAAMLVVVHRRWPRLAWGFVGTVIASQLILALPWQAGSGGGHRPWAASDYSGSAAPGRWATLMVADSLRKVHGRVLLFSREATRFDIQIDRLYVFNGGRFDGPVLVARDLGPRNVILTQRFPDRVPFLVEDQGRDRAAKFTPLPRP